MNNFKLIKNSDIRGCNSSIDARNIPYDWDINREFESDKMVNEILRNFILNSGHCFASVKRNKNKKIQHKVFISKKNRFNYFRILFSRDRSNFMKNLTEEETEELFCMADDLKMIKKDDEKSVYLCESCFDPSKVKNNFAIDVVNNKAVCLKCINQ